MTTKDNLLKFIELSGIKKSDFYRKTGLSNGFLDKNSSISSGKIENIISIYPEINLYWLITGRGEMLNNTATVENTLGADEVYVIPAVARAGALNDFVVSVRAQDCEKVTTPEVQILRYLFRA